MATNDVIARLENALEKWSVLVADSHTGLSERLGRIHRLLSNEAAARTATPAARSELQAARAQAAERENELAQAQREIERLRNSHESPRGESAALEKMLRERDLELESLREEFNKFRHGKTDGDLGQREQDVFAPPADRERRLAEALRDRDEAHREIVSLRVEIQMLRNANASLGGPVPLDTSEVEFCDELGHRRRLGDLLVSLGIITEEQRDIALHEQDVFPHRRFGAILVENGFTTEQTVAQVLARQLDLPFVHLTTEVIDVTAITAITAQLAKRHLCVPVSISPDRLTLAMANPFDVVAMDNVARATGRQVQIVVATASDIASALCRYY